MFWVILKALILLTVSLGVGVTASGDTYEKCGNNDCSGKKACATIYQHRNFGGWYQCITFKDAECVTLNDWWQEGRVSGVDTHNTCIRLYSLSGCYGDSIEIKPGSANHRYLNELNFEDRASAISSCERLPVVNPYTSKNTNRKCSQSDCSGKKGCVTLYQSRHHGGSEKCVTIQNAAGCVTLSSWWSERVSSVDLHGTCIRLYDNKDCNGAPLEIKPGSSHLDNLNQLGFEDVVGSVSSCERPMNNNDQCSYKDLFSKMIKTKDVADASDNILQVVDGIVSLAASGFSIVIPGVDLFYSGLKFVASLFSSEQSTEALIDAKIEEAFARNSASQISAKMNIIRNRLESVLSPDTPQADRRIALGLALHSCEEVMELFKDRHYSFSQNKVVSSPYLVAFSSIYLSVAKLVHELRPEMRLRITEDISELTQLNKNFMREALRQRKDKVTYSGSAVCYVLVDEVSDKERLCRSWDRNEICWKTVNSTIDHDIEKFFRPVITKLEQFL